MDLHAWITQQVDRVERLLDENEWPPSQVDGVRLRCEADRRILARHTLDLAHAHGLTDGILAGLDRPQPPEPKPHAKVAHTPAGAQSIARLLATPPITTSNVPAALRGPRWKP